MRLSLLQIWALPLHLLLLFEQIALRLMMIVAFLPLSPVSPLPPQLPRQPVHLTL